MAKKAATKKKAPISKTGKPAAKKVAAKKVNKEESNVRKLQKQNNGSTTVALPAEILRELKWRDKQKVVVRKRGEALLIEDWKPKKK